MDFVQQTHDAVRGELARLVIRHKRDLGIGGFADAEIVANVDAIVDSVWRRIALASAMGDTALVERFIWFGGAAAHVDEGQSVTNFDA